MPVQQIQKPAQVSSHTTLIESDESNKTTSPKSDWQVKTKADNSLRIHVMNVGNGNCVIAEAANTNVVLIVDCGSTKNDGAMSAQSVAAYFNKLISTYTSPPGITVIISHPDKDHYNYIPTVLANYKTLKVYLGGVPNFTNYRDCYNYSIGRNRNTAMGDWIAKQPDVSLGFAPFINKFGSGGIIVAANNVGITPNLAECPAGNYTNAASAVVYLLNGTQSISILGDATNKTLTEVNKYLTANGRPSSSNITISSHHGANTHGSNSNWWTSVNQPQYVVHSAGTRAGYNHPKCDVLRNYGSSQLHSINKLCVTCYEIAGPKSDSWVSQSMTVANITTLNSGINIFDMYPSSINLAFQYNNLNNYCQ
jgi:beta-lactamase superfamily II metal-dependent hydrolase